ncbi:MAG: FHA domain-containing protein [Chloroflexota bacterium]|nr:FHA domain-containing protein [Chloroflexota bacterium]
MTHELILVISSGTVGFILGTAMVLLLRRPPGARRVWEPDSSRFASVINGDLSQTEKQDKNEDTHANRLPLFNTDTGSGRSYTLNSTARSRIPVAVLTAKQGERSGQTWLLRQATSTTIGRFDDCDIAINDHGVSRLHAQITHRTDAATAHEFTIFDYSSTNGTMVNGQPINAVASLQDGDEIQIGDSSFIFHRVRHN